MNLLKHKDMIYAATISTPALTAASDFVETRLKITSGLIWLFEIDFPAGCCGLLHVQVFDSLYQLMPASGGESLHGDNITNRFDDLYLKQSPPFELQIRTWNLDEKWDHGTQIRIGLASTKAEMSRYMPSLSFEDFEVMLAETMAQQEAIKQAQIEQVLKELTG
jgi:hypothetical protein